MNYVFTAPLAAVSICAALWSTDAAAASACTSVAAEDVNIYSTAPATGSTLDESAGTLYDGSPSCEVIASGGGKADSEANVNAGAPFETTGIEFDWVFLAKYQVAGGVAQQDTATTDPVSGQSFFDFIVISNDDVSGAKSTGSEGYFRIDEEARAIYSEMLILLKQKDYFYMYFISDVPNASEYVFYNTPFTNRSGGAQEISHISFYGRIGSSLLTEVPLPAGAPMLLGALAAFGLLRRKRRG